MKDDSPEKKAKKNFNDIALGIILAICVFFMGVWSFNQYHAFQSMAPATNWVEVTSFTVPNFKAGVDPSIEYTRDIKQPVSSSWVSEVRRYVDNTDDYELVCTKSGFNELEPGRAAPPNGWFLSAFAGKDCKLISGRYRIFVVWTLRPKGLERSIPYSFASNAFTVQ